MPSVPCPVPPPPAPAQCTPATLCRAPAAGPYTSDAVSACAPPAISPPSNIYNHYKLTHQIYKYPNAPAHLPASTDPVRGCQCWVVDDGYVGYYNYQYKLKGMSGKRSFYAEKDYSKDRDEGYSKKIDDTPDEKVRILQSNLVFVNALPSDTSSKETLQTNLYFGRYGFVHKLILNPPYPNKKGCAYQAYVTYGSELDASLAIVSLDGYKLSQRPLKVSFGTTKYCSHFLRGHECPNSDCFYLHKVDKKRQVSNSDCKVVFKEQNNKAMRIVVDNLEEVINRILDSEVQETQEGFPSLSEVLDYLVDKQYLTQTELDQAFEDAEAKRAPDEPPLLEMRGISLPNPQRDEGESKLAKSNSHSTMCTPSKEDGRQQLRQKCEKLMHRLQQNMVGKQNKGRELQVQQKIEKLIIKEILKKGNDCRSRFIKDATATREDLSKLRGIVQKYLIAHN